ncbi:MAG: ABC transporter ATP-binding protein/permease [Alphaproteobacteria bacterium]|nr:ABC transporter ATP-binding protein/permease [Alphaproteobacteria bacterium]
MGALFYLSAQYWKAAYGRRRQAIAISFAFFVAHGLNVLEPIIMANVINTLQQSAPNDMLGNVAPLLCLWAGIFFGYNIIFRPTFFICTALAYKVKSRFISKSYKKLSALSMDWHQNNHSGGVINRINNASNSLFSFVQDFQNQCIKIFIHLFGSIAGILFIDWRIGLITIGILFVFLMTSNLINRRINEQVKKTIEANNRISAALFDFIGNMRSILVLRLGKQTDKKLDSKVASGERPTVMAWGFWNQLKMTKNSFSLMFLKVGLVSYFIYASVSSGTAVDIGALTAILLFGQKIGQSFYDLDGVHQKLLEARAQMENAGIIDQAKKLKLPKLGRFDWRTASLDKLKFSHDKSKKLLLNNAAFTFKRGEKIALMGESGTGKSSFLLMLRGLTKQGRGQLKIDGRPMKSLGSFASMTTLMLQDPEVFEDTVRYNITMGLDYSPADIDRAVKLARFDQVLTKLPNGLDTMVNERGANFSGGERQRLALARNILAASASDIILMDESTSSIDSANEEIIYDGLFKHFKNKTIIASIHKPALAQKFPRVVRIEGGNFKSD